MIISVLSSSTFLLKSPSQLYGTYFTSKYVFYADQHFNLDTLSVYNFVVVVSVWVCAAGRKLDFNAGHSKQISVGIFYGKWKYGFRISIYEG